MALTPLPQAFRFNLKRSKMDQLGISRPVFIFRLNLYLSPYKPILTHFNQRLYHQASSRDPLFNTEKVWICHLVSPLSTHHALEQFQLLQSYWLLVSSSLPQSPWNSTRSFSNQHFGGYDPPLSLNPGFLVASSPSRFCSTFSFPLQTTFSHFIAPPWPLIIPTNSILILWTPNLQLFQMNCCNSNLRHSLCLWKSP